MIFMKYKAEQFISSSEFSPSFAKLSEHGKNSLSCKIVRNYYVMASTNLTSIRESLRRCRDESGQPLSLSPSELKPSSYRLEFELVALIASNLTQMPDLENFIKDDKETTNEDKLILLTAYQGFKNKVDGLFKLFGWPCFGFKQEKKLKKSYIFIV